MRFFEMEKKLLRVFAMPLEGNGQMKGYIWQLPNILFKLIIEKCR
jgi:hypothetical protein